jgi:hypothetical protein
MRAAIEALGSLQRRACGDSATSSIRTVAAGADSLDEPINDTAKLRTCMRTRAATMPGGAGRRAGTRGVSDAIDPRGQHGVRMPIRADYPF